MQSGRMLDSFTWLSADPRCLSPSLMKERPNYRRLCPVDYGPKGCTLQCCVLSVPYVSKQYTIEATINHGDMTGAVSKLCQTCAVDYHRARVACGPGSNDGWHRAIGAIDPAAVPRSGDSPERGGYGAVTNGNVATL